jgi:hypothetical protein
MHYGSVRLHQPSPADGAIPAPSSAGHEPAEPDQNTLRAFCRKSEPSYPVIDGSRTRFLNMPNSRAALMSPGTFLSNRRKLVI